MCLKDGGSNEAMMVKLAIADWLNDGKIDAFKLAKEMK